MAHFRKRPVEIEALYYDGSYPSAKEILDWADESVSRTDLVSLQVKTLEGTLTISPGDWVIRGVKGEYYPCRDDIFQATYEPV